MKLLLTSQMITNKRIANALAGMMTKSFGGSVVTYIITSHNAASSDKVWLVDNLVSIRDLGWRKMNIIDVAGMDGLPRSTWKEPLEEADVIVVGGGANYFLSYWLDKSGILDELPRLLEKRVYVGASAGSMIAQQNLCTSSNAMKEFSEGNWDVDELSIGPIGLRSSRTLNLVDFMMRPHYGDGHRNYITDDLIQRVANHFDKRVYAIDDDTAIAVNDNKTEIITDGVYKIFDPEAEVSR